MILKYFLMTSHSERKLSVKATSVCLCFGAAAIGLVYMSAADNTEMLTVTPAGQDIILLDVQAPSGHVDMEDLLKGADERPVARTVAAASPLPVPRPAVAAGTGKSKLSVARTRPTRERNAVVAGVERFDQCASTCETRDPMVAAMNLPAETQSTLGGAGTTIRSQKERMPSAGQNVPARGREVIAWIVGAPGATLDAGKEAISRVVSATW